MSHFVDCLPECPDDARDYIVIFADAEAQFRWPELRALESLFDLHITWEISDKTKNLARARVTNEESIRNLCSRSIAIKSVYEYWAGPYYDYPSMFENLVQDLKAEHKLTLQDPDLRFAAARETCGGRPWAKHQVPLFQALLQHLQPRGRASMKDAQIHWTMIEYWDREQVQASGHVTLDISQEDPLTYRTSVGSPLQQLWLGRDVCEGQRKALIPKLDLRKYPYIGNTSMDQVLSIYTANQAHVKPGSIIYDPFIGTGTLVIPALVFGAILYGSDLDARQFLGKLDACERKGMRDTFESLGIAKQILDTVRADLSSMPWRIDGFVDAIITDVPYGIRAGARRIGRPQHKVAKPVKAGLPDQPHIMADWVPTTIQYSNEDLLEDLYATAARLLRPGGRLVFWTAFTASPEATSREIEDSLHLPSSSVLIMVEMSVQKLKLGYRALVTVQKV